MLKRLVIVTAVPMAVAFVVGVLGLSAIAAGRPWLFASVGPTAALQTAAPDLPMSRPWNVVVSHLIGLGTGIACVYLTGAVNAPAFSPSHALVLSRVWAAVLAIAVSMCLEMLVRATHAPATSTTLLVALGIIAPSWSNALTILCGIVIVAVLGEGVRRVRKALEAAAS